MLLTLKDCRVISECIARPWTCETRYDPGYMVAKFFDLMKSRFSLETTLVRDRMAFTADYELVILNKDGKQVPMYRTIVVLRFDRIPMGHVTRLICKNMKVELIFNKSYADAVPHLDRVVLDAAPDCLGAILDSKDVV